MSTVQVDTAGDLVLAHIADRDEVIAMDTDEAMDLFLALARGLPELQAALKDFVARMGGR